MLMRISDILLIVPLLSFTRMFTAYPLRRITITFVSPKMLNISPYIIVL